MYRPHTASSDWTDYVEQSLEKGNSENKEVLLLHVGDFNFNILNKTGHVRAWLLKTEKVELFTTCVLTN